MTGAIEGGWGYVYAAYIVTWVFLGGYAVSLWMRRPPSTPEVNDERER